MAGDPLDRIRWRRAIAASVLINGALIAFCSAFTTLGAEQVVQSLPSIARISIDRLARREVASPRPLRASSAQHEPIALRSATIALPSYAPTVTARVSMEGQHVVPAVGRLHATAHVDAGVSGAGVDPGSSGASGSSRDIHGYDEYFRNAIQRAKNAADVPTGPLVASTMRPIDPGRGFAFHMEPKLNAASWPLPERGLFAHARVVRTDVDAAAIRATTKIGGMWFCIGYYVKIDKRNAENSLAGPYAGPCHRNWLVQLGIDRAPASSESSAPATSPAVDIPTPLASPSFGRGLPR